MSLGTFMILSRHQGMTYWSHPENVVTVHSRKCLEVLQEEVLAWWHIEDPDGPSGYRAWPKQPEAANYRYRQYGNSDGKAKAPQPDAKPKGPQPDARAGAGFRISGVSGFEVQFIQQQGAGF